MSDDDYYVDDPYLVYREWPVVPTPPELAAAEMNRMRGLLCFAFRVPPWVVGFCDRPGLARRARWWQCSYARAGRTWLRQRLPR